MSEQDKRAEFWRYELAEMEYLGNQYKWSHAGYVSDAYASLSARAKSALAPQAGPGAKGPEEKSKLTAYLWAKSNKPPASGEEESRGLSEEQADQVEAEMRRLEADPEVSKRALRLYMQSPMPCGHAVGNLLTCDKPPIGCVICGEPPASEPR